MLVTYACQVAAQLYLDASCQMLIVEVRIWPEAKVEGVHNEQVLDCQRTMVTKMQVCITGGSITGVTPGTASDQNEIKMVGPYRQGLHLSRKLLE